MSMRTWNWGIIGAGMIAEFHAKAIAELENVQLVSVCANTEASASRFADKHGITPYVGYESMLDDAELDIVSVATPSGLHCEPALLAADKGIHVICEKPIEIATDRIDAMVAAHKSAGTQLGGIFPYRFNDLTQVLKHAIDSGRLGKISYVSVGVPWWRDQAYYQDTWKGTQALDGGGALMNQSIHMIDLLCHLMPPIVSVSANVATAVHDIEVEDTASANLVFENGALGHIYGTTASYPGRLRQFEITGSNGTIACVEDSITEWQFRDEQPEDAQIREQYQASSTSGGASDPAAITHENHRRNFEAFLNAITNNEPFVIDGLEAKKAVKLILDIYESARSGTVLKF